VHSREIAAFGVVAQPISDHMHGTHKRARTLVSIQSSSITGDFSMLIMAAHEHWATSATDCHRPEFLIGLDVVVVSSRGGQLQVQVMVLRFVVFHEKVAASCCDARSMLKCTRRSCLLSNATYRNFEARTKRDDMFEKAAIADTTAQQQEKRPSTCLIKHTNLPTLLELRAAHP